MRVTIVGAGNMGRGIGTGLVVGGNEVELVDQNPEDSRTLAEELGELATSNRSVTGDVVILALPYEAVAGALAEHQEGIAGRIVIDIVNQTTSTFPTQRRPTQRRAENDVAETCEHLEDLKLADFPAPRTPQGCEECLAEGTRWVALRECLACGHVGCCDSSPGTHATRHYHQTGHPVMRSIMPGDAWSWCYVDEVTGQLA